MTKSKKQTKLTNGQLQFIEMQKNDSCNCAVNELSFLLNRFRNINDCQLQTFATTHSKNLAFRYEEIS
jgi:hypothetical protein